MRPLFDVHAHFISDEPTMSAYRAAIGHVRPGDVVLDIGAGTGILGYMACDAGASRVLAIERSGIIELAREVAIVNGMAERITHYQHSSLDVDIAEKADVAIFSMLARFGVEDGILGTVVDARRRLLKSGATLIPSAVELFVAPAELPEWYADRIDRWNGSPWGWSCGAARTAAVSTPAAIRAGPDALVAAPVSVAALHFDSIEFPDLHCVARCPAVRSGHVHAILGWSEWTFADAVTRCNAPSDRPWWSQIVFPLERPLAVRDGDVVEIDISMNQVDDVGQSWSWTTRTRSAGSTVIAECRHSTSSRTSAVPATINDSRSVYALASDALGLFDGRRTVGDIAATLRTLHPTAFVNPEGADRVVRWLSTQWSV